MLPKWHFIFLFTLTSFAFYKGPSAKAAPTPISAAAFNKPVSYSFKDTTRTFNPQRILLLTDTSKQARRVVQTRRFYRSLKHLFYQSKLSRKLFDLLIVSPSEQNIPSEAKKAPAERYQAFQDKIIGTIRIRKLDIFGPTVNDTSKLAENWLQKTGNMLHIPTQTRVIRKNLLIEEGDRVQPQQIADNERVLRELPFIRDARLYLKPRPGTDTVDVLVLSQDYFPYSAGGSFKNLQNLSLRIDQNNLAGLGHQFSNQLIYDQDQRPQLGYKGIYSVPNLAGLFIDSRLTYTRTERVEEMGVYLQRSFYTPDILWAGGLQLNKTDILKSILFLDAGRDTLLRFQYDHSNLWLARSFPLTSPQARARGRRTRLVVGGRFALNNYKKRPLTAPDEQQYFHLRRLYLGSIGLSSRNYFRDQYIFAFGRTEDVPVGFLANILIGYENSEFYERPFAGLSLQAADYFPAFGYLHGLLKIESYFKEAYQEQTYQAEQRLLHLEANYFSPLISWKEFRFRQLLTLDYTYGDRRFAHEFLTVGYENVRGLHTYQERGTQRFSLGLETISFTPLYILDFQLAAFGFADIAFLNRSPFFSLKGQAFQGYGFGLRVRNDHLSFDTFQLRFTLYPNTPGRDFGITLSGIPSQLFRDFRIGEPSPFLFH